MSNLIVHESKGIAVIESAPTCRTIQVGQYTMNADGSCSYDYQKYYLAFPYVVFVVPVRMFNGTHGQSHGIRVGFRNKKLTAKDQRLYYPHLYNIYACTLRVCMEPVSSPIKDHALYQAAVRTFWQTTFQLATSLHNQYVHYGCYSTDKRVVKFTEWEKNTLKDPTFITSVAWKPCNDLAEIIQILRADL